MRLLLAANNQATRRNEIIKSYLQLGSSSNRYAPRLPQQETKSSTKQLPPTAQFWVRKTFSKPASLKRASLVVDARYHKELSILKGLMEENFGASLSVNKHRVSVMGSTQPEGRAVSIRSITIQVFPINGAREEPASRDDLGHGMQMWLGPQVPGAAWTFGLLPAGIVSRSVLH